MKDSTWLLLALIASITIVACVLIAESYDALNTARITETCKVMDKAGDGYVCTLRATVP